MERKWKWRPKQHGSGDPKKVDMSARKTVGVEFAKKMWAGKGMEVWKAIGSGVRQASVSGFRKEIGGWRHTGHENVQVDYKKVAWVPK